MQTYRSSIHEYQQRIYSFRNQNLTFSLVNQLQSQITTFKSIILPQNYIKNSDNYFIDEEREKLHEVIYKIGDGAISVTHKVIDTQKSKIMCKMKFEFKKKKKKKQKSMIFASKKTHALSRMISQNVSL